MHPRALTYAQAARNHWGYPAAMVRGDGVELPRGGDETKGIAQLINETRERATSAEETSVISQTGMYPDGYMYRVAGTRSGAGKTWEWKVHAVSNEGVTHAVSLRWP